MRLDETESQGWEQALEQYIKAIQDYDYIETRSKSTRDPFLVTGEYRADNYILKCYIDREIAKRITSYADSLKLWDGHDKPNSPISVARLKDGFLKLFMAAAAGGAFLIGPMWLMVLDGGLYTSLITTSAFVTVFGLWMAYLLPKMDEVLGSTAAYAAVLIVFVGTSS
ncbi:hypothetical protein K456DRAFT_1724221 [Colletotrichum gloeosporioides 23]|nr:hypothetical protein K456DRAFT_1724221 [Colletotrichum gloeosporioides 23]